MLSIFYGRLGKNMKMAALYAEDTRGRGEDVAHLAAPVASAGTPEECSRGGTEEEKGTR